MSNLEVLGLGRNNFTGPIPSELGSMSVLSTYALCPDSLTFLALTYLDVLHSLLTDTIGFEHNFLNGTIPSELGNLSDMRKFLVSVS